LREGGKDRNVKKLRPRFKLWLSSSEVEGVFGDGKWRLLRAIEREGSLRAACESLNISYRKAWGDVKKAQEGLGVALVRKERGGRTGGQTALTAEGQRWVRAYTRFRRDIEKTVARAYQKYFVELPK
jgi:molybdate transport system regulatory protein